MNAVSQTALWLVEPKPFCHPVYRTRKLPQSSSTLRSSRFKFVFPYFSALEITMI